MAAPLGSYAEFWPHYLRAHRNRRSRGLHYAGTSLALLCLAMAIATMDWRFLIAAPVVGYAFAWIGHLGFEGNRPATFGHPFWSLFSDLRMLGLWVTGRLGPHLAQAGVEAG
ncbi:MAG TPA: DUF962 domain-containing protein [Stellaceae bacterium]|nr:DUF962 domain-containing protein [Stellaceae bacterium]